jgi:hypothetical protein
VSLRCSAETRENAASAIVNRINRRILILTMR